MKQSKYILLSIAVLLVIILGFIKTDKQSEIKDENKTETSSVASCYIWNTEAGDSAKLKLVFDITDLDNNTISGGFFDFSPAGKDKKSGPLSGSFDVEGDRATGHLIWDASAEGVTNKEELIVIFGLDIAQPGFGEMKESSNGIFVYADPKNISYPINLQRTDCDDSAMN